MLFRSRLKASPYVNVLLENLPFELTCSQIEVWNEIEADLYHGNVCNRLLQGDVGSGKTIIAILALLTAASSGYQSAFMAPTEVLARQHYRLLQDYIQKLDFPFEIGLLTGESKAKDKEIIYEKLRSGAIQIVVGTHALLEESVTFQRLSLVITDEQHRFGVNQRLVLTQKGKDVHTIVMSATPIPRSLAMILYGGLDISSIKQKPSNRLPIKNCVVGQEYREIAYQFITQQVKESRHV